MKLRIAALAWMLASIGATSSFGQKDNQRVVTVYVVGEEQVPLTIRSPGQGIASAIFREIGIRIDWRLRHPSAGDVYREQALVIEITGAPAPYQQPVVALALPYEGSAVKVYFGSIRWAEARPFLMPRLYGHVLAHEIAHMLQQLDYHAATGVLKAHWTGVDYNQMERAPLRFEASDIEFIHRGLDARDARRVAARDR